MSTNQDVAPDKPSDGRGTRPTEHRKELGLAARRHRRQEKYTYEKGKPETWRHVLYCDPKRLEYYDDGSLRIMDPDMVDAIRRWSRTAEGEAILSGKEAKGPALDINGRGC